MLHLRRYTNGGDFLQATQPVLAQAEAANNLMLGIAIRLRDHPERYQAAPYLATIEAQGRIGMRLVVAALMTPPFPLLVFAAPDAAADDLVEAYDVLIDSLALGDWQPVGVNGRVPHSLGFAERWGDAYNQRFELTMALRVYELRTVIAPLPVSGCFRIAQPADLDLLWHWYRAFTTEAETAGASPPEREAVARIIAAGDLYLWDDGGPVSMAAKARRLPHGISVGPVYTPPEQRNRGYAAACVAHLSQSILDAGYLYCTLFTDLANPTSNAIYQKIGYVPLCDFANYRFLP